MAENAGHPETRTVPDPSSLTTEALIRAVAAERDYVDGRINVILERLRGIDVATELLNETVTRTPTDITKEITHLRELMEVQFRSVHLQFAERDTRQERESRDNKVAVDAAFAAQKEAAAKQDEGNQKSIDKSERSTSETIAKLMRCRQPSLTLRSASGTWTSGCLRRQQTSRAARSPSPLCTRVSRLS